MDGLAGLASSITYSQLPGRKCRPFQPSNSAAPELSQFDDARQRSSVGPQYRAILCSIQVSLILTASFPALAQYPLPMASHGASRPPFGLTITFHRSGKVLPSFRLLSMDKPAPSLEEFRILWLMSRPPHRGCP